MQGFGLIKVRFESAHTRKGSKKKKEIYREVCTINIQSILLEMLMTVTNVNEIDADYKEFFFFFGVTYFLKGHEVE